jgi:hypothetical protein
MITLPKLSCFAGGTAKFFADNPVDFTRAWKSGMLAKGAAWFHGRETRAILVQGKALCTYEWPEDQPPPARAQRVNSFVDLVQEYDSKVVLVIGGKLYGCEEDH